jgi:hypothetical protein
MSKSQSKGPGPEPDDERHDFDLPYPRHFPAGMHRFRQLLAELIARRIRVEQRKRPDGGDAGKY